MATAVTATRRRPCRLVRCHRLRSARAPTVTTRGIVGAVAVRLANRTGTDADHLLETVDVARTARTLEIAVSLGVATRGTGSANHRRPDASEIGAKIEDSRIQIAKMIAIDEMTAAARLGDSATGQIPGSVGDDLIGISVQITTSLGILAGTVTAVCYLCKVTAESFTRNTITIKRAGTMEQR